MDAKSEVTLIVERLNESSKWFRDNYGQELAEVYRAIKCKTKPIFKRDENGRETNEEDLSRTNVAFPTLNLIFRRNVARMTAQAYRLRYTGGTNPLVAEMLSAQALMQYDRTNERWHDRRVVMMGEYAGFGYSKLYWDTLARTMNFRKAVLKNNQVVYRDRASIMKFQGAPEDEITGALQTLGSDMKDEEVSNAMGKSGSEITVPTEVKKYEGPILKSVFIGNLHLPPKVLTLEDADWIIEDYTETDLWLKKAKELRRKDEETGEMVPIFDAKAIDELLATEPETERKIDDLERDLDAAIGKQTADDYQYPKRLRARKIFNIYEQHELDEDGRIQVTWCSPKLKDKPLGKGPYPWDLYGEYTYTEHVPLPDMISAYGDSMPRILRHLYALHNLTVAQNFDAIGALLRRFLLVKDGVKFPDGEPLDRGAFLRMLRVSDPNGIVPLQEPTLPAGMFEREAQVLRMMSLAEPSMNTVDTGSASNPMAGKLATTAMLNAKAADTLTQYKIDGRDMYLKKVGQKKLWMNQQMATEPSVISDKYWTPDLRDQIADIPKEWALSDRNGKTVGVRLDPLEIQEDLQVEPEAGSYLSVDDEIRQDAAMKVQAVATANPGIVDQRKLARFQLGTIRGIGNPDDFIVPEQTAPAPPDVRVSATVSIKWPELTPEQQAQVLERAGIQVNPEGLQAAQQVHEIKQVADGADAASRMTAPAEGEQQEMIPSKKAA